MNIRLRIKNNKVLLGNVFSLSLLQFVNYVLPLATLPYLVRVLGPSRYGLIAFAQALMAYFIIATDYGFVLSGAREVSACKDDKARLSGLFSSVMVIKFALTAFSFLALCLLFTLPKFGNDWQVYLFSFMWVVAHVIFPVWFFQGVEHMKYITFMTILSKAIFTCAVFMVIKKESDYLYVPLLSAIGYLIASVISLGIVFARFGIRPVAPSAADIRRQLSGGWHIFISTVFMGFFGSTTTFILGIFTNNTVVGYYAAADRIIRVLLQMFNPVFQAIYPQISRFAIISRSDAISKLNKLFRMVAPVSVALFLGVFILSGKISRIVLGAAYAESGSIIAILSPLLVIVPAAYIFANLTLLPFKLDRYFAGIYISGAVINVALVAVAVMFFGLGGAGAAFSAVVAELIVTLFMRGALRKNGIIIGS